MKALIAFIIMVLVILVLIEINERFKFKRKKPSDTNCQKPDSTNQTSVACADCELAKQCPSQLANDRKNHLDNENPHTSA